jgi:tRNA-specific 2-thiouridylase
VGELKKTEVRRIAAEIGLPNAKKKDSTGICFIGERPFREFLNRYLQPRAGPMLDERGRRLGQHVGLSFYTLGQRQGLGIGGVKSGGGEHAALVRGAQGTGAQRAASWCRGTTTRGCCRTLTADDCSWIAGTPPAAGALAAKTRYRQADAACTFGTSAGFALRFDQPQWAVTPGQSAVLYDGEVCLGGGVIASAVTLARALRLSCRHERFSPRTAGRAGPPGAGTPHPPPPPPLALGAAARWCWPPARR